MTEAVIREVFDERANLSPGKVSRRMAAALDRVPEIIRFFLEPIEDSSYDPAGFGFLLAPCTARAFEIASAVPVNPPGQGVILGEPKRNSMEIVRSGRGESSGLRRLRAHAPPHPLRMVIDLVADDEDQSPHQKGLPVLPLRTVVDAFHAASKPRTRPSRRGPIDSN